MQSDDDRQAAKRALAQQSCPHCRITITAHQAIHPGHCGAPQCATAQAIKGRQTREEQRSEDYATRQNEMRAKIGDELAQAAMVLGRNAKDILLAVVPFQNAPVVPLKEEARAALEAHITRIVTEAFEAGPDDINMLNYVSGAAKEPSIIAAGCAACQGSCCKRGGGDNHAFLTRQTIYHMRKNNPELEPEAVIQHYLEALPSLSVQDACLFQGEDGCTLDRAWRSSTCNTFLCHDIHSMHDVTGGRTDVPLAIVSVEEDQPGKVIAFDASLGTFEIS